MVALLRSEAADGFADWRIAETPDLIEISDVLCSVIWSEMPNGIARTLIPFQFRGFEAVVA